MRAFISLPWACLAAVSLSGAMFHAQGAAPDRLRLIVETDAGGDPDDEQSLVRFLLYANEWDVEGIIANRPEARPQENLNPERTGLGIVRRLISAYGQCYDRLAQHDPRFPTPESLLSVTVAGYAEVETGVDLIIRAVDRDDPRPVWFLNWGTDHGSAPSCLRRALDRVQRERGEAAYALFKHKLRLSSADAFGPHTTALAPPWSLWVDTFRPEIDGRRWYHRFSALTARAGGFDVEKDVRTGHGPLGALYPTNTTHRQKEGDSMTFIYLIPNGLGDPGQPGWGSWAGRYGPQDNSGKSYYWANQGDFWNGTRNRDNTLARWATALQNDFRARLDWCVRPWREANHPPQAVLNGKPGTEALCLTAAPGSEVTLDARGSSDPDRDSLVLDWFVYPEAGNYSGNVALSTSNSPITRLRMPIDAAGKSIHVIVAVTDSGQPPLARYRRAVIQVRNPESAWKTIAPLFQPPPEFAGKFGKFRSPLIGDNGRAIQTAAGWPQRRAQILHDWQTLMGPWPELIARPKVEVLSRARRECFEQRRVRLEIAPGQSGEGWLLVPDVAARLPAVLIVYYEPETSVGLGKESLRDFGYQLARRGFVTLSIGTPGGNAWKPETGQARCQPLSFQAYVAANCWQVLANLPEVDPERIGMIGHSYGGKWALFAGALWDKFAAVAVSDPGIVFDETRPNVNYWEPWYLGAEEGEPRKPGIPGAQNPRTGAYKRLVQQGRDLPEFEALIAPRPFLVSGGSEDPPERWLALNQLVRLNQLLGYTNRVAMSNRSHHTPTEQSNEQLCAFFEYFLGGKAEMKPASNHQP